MTGHKVSKNTICPKCQTAFRAEDDTQSGDAPMAVCPKCKHVFFTKEPEDIDAEVFGEEEKGPIADIWSKRTQHKRYLTLLLVLFLVVVGYQVSEYLLNQNLLNETRDRAAQAMLKTVAKAQEAYYAATGAYAAALPDLKEYFKPARDIVIDITRANAKSWAGVAYHAKSPNAYIYDSDQGGVQPDPVPIPKAE